MLPSTDTALAQASFRLSQMLSMAQNATSQDSGPMILQQTNFDISKLADIRVIVPGDQYLKKDTDSTIGGNYVNGHEHIKELLADGFMVVTVMIVRAFNFGATTKHEVNVILVKLQD